MTTISPVCKWTAGPSASVTQHVPCDTMWYDTTCCAPGRMVRTSAVAVGISSAHGEVASNGKNSAPVSRIVRRTSESTSTVASWPGAPDTEARDSDDRSWCSATEGSYLSSHDY